MSALALLLIAAPIAPFAAQPVADAELAAQRGGFTLPNGIDVSLTVQTQTAINGAVVLATVYRAEQGPPTFTVYAPKPGETVTVDTKAPSAVPGNAAAPVISFDNHNGLQVTPGGSAPVITVSAGIGGGGAIGALPAGLQQVLTGDDAVTVNGRIVQAAGNGVQTVALQAPDLTITHFVGNAFGSAIENSGSNRAIDTQTSIALDLHNAGPDVLGSALLRVQDIAAAATQSRIN